MYAKFGATATIVMPDHAASVKVDAIRAYGADIIMCPQPEREARLAELVAESGATVVHPFDDPAVVAGQGTATLELVEDVPGLDVAPPDRSPSTGSGAYA